MPRLGFLTKETAIFLLTTFALMGQRTKFIQSVARDDFHNCKDVENDALKFGKDVQDPTYFMVLYPGDKPSYYYFHSPAFFSEIPWSPAAFAWIGGVAPETLADAIFYSVPGGYTFRCRDDQGRFTQSSSAGGDVLALAFSWGKAVIWHFTLGIGVPSVFVTTDVALDKINGDELMVKVKQVLGAKAVLLYVRNDPWFFGYAYDIGAFMFTNGRERLTVEEYLKTKTMLCDGAWGCRIVRSQE